MNNNKVCIIFSVILNLYNVINRINSYLKKETSVNRGHINSVFNSMCVRFFREWK